MVINRSKQTKPNGFTLVELLVALTILALVLSLIFSSLQFSVRTADAVEAKIEASERIHLVHRMLRRQLQQVLPVRMADDDDADRIDFSGRIDEIEFVGPMPAPLLYPGLYRTRLTVMNDLDSREHGKKLVMKYRPFVESERSRANTQDWEEIVVLNNFSDAEWNYQDTSGRGQGYWTTDWNDDYRLPDLIRLRIKPRGRGEANAIEMIIAPRITTLAANSGV